MVLYIKEALLITQRMGKKKGSWMLNGKLRIRLKGPLKNNVIQKGDLFEGESLK